MSWIEEVLKVWILDVCISLILEILMVVLMGWWIYVVEVLFLGFFGYDGFVFSWNVEESSGRRVI